MEQVRCRNCSRKQRIAVKKNIQIGDTDFFYFMFRYFFFQDSKVRHGTACLCDMFEVVLLIVRGKQVRQYNN